MYGLKNTEHYSFMIADELEGLIAYLRKFDVATGGLAEHISDTENPHAVTAAQIGAPTSASFQDHSARHENGGADEISVSGLSGVLADAQTPSAHATNHSSGGSDPVTVTNLVGVASSVYTPTLTGVANVAASTAYACQYIRIGDTVTVSGKVDIDPTSGTTLTQLGVSLPVASNLAAEEQCAGTAAAHAVAGYSAAILGDATNNRAEVRFTTAADVANRSWFFTFTYRVI